MKIIILNAVNRMISLEQIIKKHGFDFGDYVKSVSDADNTATIVAVNPSHEDQRDEVVELHMLMVDLVSDGFELKVTA